MMFLMLAVCTKTLGPLSTEAVREGIARRLPALASLGGLPDGAERVPHVVVTKVEREPAPIYVSYDDREGVVCLATPLHGTMELDDNMEGFQIDARKSEGDLGDALRACMANAVDMVRIEKVPDMTDEEAWPLAMAMAASLAEQGNGLVYVLPKEWVAPEGAGIRVLGKTP